MGTDHDPVLTLTPDEARQTAELTLRLAERYAGDDDPELILDLPRLATGPPPEDRHERPRPNREFPEEILVLLYAGLLGEPFGWTTQRDGRLVHDVFPVREHEHDQLGLGSKELLTRHTEDAFHPYRGDYPVLASLRNPDRVATTVGEYVPHALSPADPEDDPEARPAPERRIAVIDGGLREVALEQGDCLVINNRRVVHGRVPFTARFDGTDRGLKRINVTHDLRKSRTMRASSSTRLIG
ncbi:TauD/TfdA family dioxygenase [Streptomyces sp. NPDC010273]|uniref:TauD/TfdA family dioxygenase n=1 Tax=Streptomyces sp. NPDC010273 TaxID=3364829 RepID=UPI0036E3FDBA